MGRKLVNTGFKCKQLFYTFFAVVILAIFIRIFIGEPCYIPSDSMEPAVRTGDWLWIDKITYGARLPVRWSDIPLINVFTWIPSLRDKDNENNWGYHRSLGIRKPQKHDIVIFNSPEEEVLLVKRINHIFKKGDTVIVHTGNFELMKKTAQTEGNLISTVNKNIHINNRKDSCYIFQNNYYDVRGDNKSSSRDSRHWGYIPESAVIGKASRVIISVQKGESRVLHKIE